MSYYTKIAKLHSPVCKCWCCSIYRSGVVSFNKLCARRKARRTLKDELRRSVA